MQWRSAENPLHTFLRNFRETGKLPTCWQQVVVMEFGKWHNTTDDCPRQLVTDLLYGKTGVMDFGLKSH